MANSGEMLISFLLGKVEKCEMHLKISARWATRWSNLHAPAVKFGISNANGSDFLKQFPITIINLETSY